MKKKKKLTNLSIIVILVVVALFTIITSIVVNHQKRKLEDLKDKNDQVTTPNPSEETETPANLLKFL